MPGFAIHRQTDIGAHGDIALTASPNVLANSLGVHRLTDIAICPVHGVGITLINCSSTVKVNGLGVAHVTSCRICGDGSVSMCVLGSPNVFVGG